MTSNCPLPAECVALSQSRVIDSRIGRLYAAAQVEIKRRQLKGKSCKLITLPAHAVGRQFVVGHFLALLENATPTLGCMRAYNTPATLKSE